MHGDSWFAPLFGKKGACSFLTQTQLCPIIWGIVIGLMSMFFFKVCLGSRAQGFSLLCTKCTIKT